ncbi:MAG: MFS transporter [Rhodobacteraceae bacterium]|jgi:MFS family permease|nr:MFS transporter [Paracoccaceae bacterium]
MRLGIAVLLAGYVLSQFYRAFLAVLAPVLGAEIGATPDDLARANGIFFLTFAAMQIPVGAALDRVGPRRTAAALVAVGAAGAAVMALARGPLAVDAAMALVGVGMSPVLMSLYYLFARVYPAGMFGTLAGAALGFGSLGNILGTLPLAAAVEAFGWRPTLWAMAVATLAVSALAGWRVPDPPRVAAPPGRQGTVLTLLRIPALWAILPLMLVNYVPAAGLRGLWLGPYLADIHGADIAAIGWVTLAMGLAMIAGNFAYGPLDRLFGTRKGVVLAGNLLGLAALLVLALAPPGGAAGVAAVAAAVGFFGASFPMIMAHGRAFFPPHLVGRGVTLLNLFGIGGVGLMQVVSGRVHAAGLAGGGPEAAYATLFLFFAAALGAGCAVYLFARDRTD